VWRVAGGGGGAARRGRWRGRRQRARATPTSSAVPEKVSLVVVRAAGARRARRWSVGGSRHCRCIGMSNDERGYNVQSSDHSSYFNNAHGV
jgi:hypothetical protein